MEKSESCNSIERIDIEESADSLLAEAMKLPGVADYFSVYGEYQKIEAEAAPYFAAFLPKVSWNTTDTATS